VVRRHPFVFVCLLTGALGLPALLAGCDSLLYSDGHSRLPDPFETVKNTDLQPRFPQQTDATQPPPKAAKSFSFFGRDDKDKDKRDSKDAKAEQPAANGARPADSGDGYELNFENAAVTTVTKVIIGDILGAGYSIDPRVQGTVTISSGRPVPKSDLIFVLENALRTSNSVLVPDNGGYRIIPAGEAQGSGVTNHSGDTAEGGYGITVVPLRYASAPTILKLLDSFALKAGSARADVTRNLIVVQGSGPERKAAAETVLNFDVDWMRGQSVGVYPVKNAAPEVMINELEKIMANGENGINRNLVTLQPVARLNAVLVVTQKPNLLKMAATWIERLDRTNYAGSGVHVYRMKYGNARQVAKLLTDIFGSKSKDKDRGLDSSVNQIAPGGGLATSSSDRLASNSTGSQSGFGGSQAGFGSQSSGLGNSGGFGSSGGAFGGSGGGIGTNGGYGGTSTGGGLGSGGSGGSANSPFGLGRTAGTSGADDQGSSTLELPGVRITADTNNNALVIYANQENYRLIEQTITQLDRPQLQVAIHATIVEVTLNNDLQYGVQYFLQNKIGTASLTNSNSASAVNSVTSNSSGLGGLLTTSPAQSTVSNVASTFLNQMLPGASIALGSATNPKAILDALRTVTDVKVISSPSLVVMNNQIATLVVGDQVPVTTQSATAVTAPGSPLVSSIDYRNTGVILSVSPSVNVNGNVLLDISQEVSDVAANANATTLTPTLSQRKIKSTITVASGQSVLLGGLISETQSRSRSGIPVLEEIPYLGNAFSQNDRSTARTELIVFMQPEIIRDSVDAYKVAEELRSKLRGSAEAAFPPGPSLYKDPRFVR
jgi:general secretion pathway protein D